MNSIAKPEIDERVSVGFFGTFYPQSRFVGTASTGIVRALMLNENVESLLVFSQLGSYLPSPLKSSKVEMVPCWIHNDLFSLIHGLRIMWERSRKLDGFIFNVYITAFGRSSIANAFGLLVPSLLALSTRKPVIVYMHNFLETQDVLQLGYHPTLAQRLGVRFLERLLLRCTTVVVPLKSQQEKIAAVFGTTPRRVPLPFVEPFGLAAASNRPLESGDVSSDEPTRILLLGNWGPQKDLAGILYALRTAHDQGGRFAVTVTGAINAQFPNYRREFTQLVGAMDPKWFRSLGSVSEDEILDLIFSHDLLVLPYNTTGGYSGAMSVGAYCDIGIIAYDLLQLRESADELGIQPLFVTKGDSDGVVKAILSFCSNVQSFRESRLSLPRPDYDARALESIERLVEIMTSRRQF